MDFFGLGEKVSKEIAAGIILVCCQFGQHILQIFVDPETVCFCSLYQAVHDGTGFCSADGIHVDPVLTRKGERTDGALCGIVIHRNFPVSQEESASLSMTGSRDDTAEHLVRDRGIKREGDTTKRDRDVLLIHESADSRESHNSCNGAGACGVIGTMSGRIEST